MRSFGEPLTKLRAIPTEECGEPLLDPRTLSKRIHFALKHPKFPNMKRTPKVRKRVAEMLAQAAESLPEGIGLQIIEGWRPLEQQKFMYDALREEIRQQHPHWGHATLIRMTDRLSAPPGDKAPPPHLTGGAVDLCLIHESSGERLDVTSPFEMGNESAPTAMRGLSQTAQANRRLLIETLEPTGLTNYAGEWWHWSYGDQGWALRTGNPKAIYGRMEDLKESR